MDTNKRFSKGDIVYWCEHKGNANYSVSYGMVDEEYYGTIVVDYLMPRERRLIDGVPIEDFQSEQRFRKLPKGWTYNTKLFEMTLRETISENELKLLGLDSIDELINFDTTKPDNVKRLVDLGLFVKAETIYQGHIEAEITKDGFRIIQSYPYYIHPKKQASIHPSKLYFTYDEAKKEVDGNIAEFFRQASLSDYDWSAEQINKTLNHWQKIYDKSDVKKNEYKKFLFDLKNIEDIEIRLFGGEIQWKHWNNKKWLYIQS